MQEDIGVTLFGREIGQIKGPTSLMEETSSAHTSPASRRAPTPKISGRLLEAFCVHSRTSRHWPLVNRHQLCAWRSASSCHTSGEEFLPALTLDLCSFVQARLSLPNMRERDLFRHFQELLIFKNDITPCWMEHDSL